MYQLHDRALVEHGRPRLESDSPAASAGAALGALLRKAASESWVARWSAWLLGTAIHVSPMSDTWLRAHDDRSSKRGMDL